jgi:hypothetical protein
MLLVTLAAMFVISCSGKAVLYSPYELQEFPPKIQQHIKNGEVSLGMSPQAVRYSWGAPKAVRVRESEDGSYVEEWIYTRLRVFATRLTFVEGKLAGIISGPAKSKPLSSLMKKQKDDVKQEPKSVQEQ